MKQMISGTSNSARGRRELLDDEMTAQICRNIRRGLRYKDAAILAGIHPRTFQKWLKQGRVARSGRYFRLVQELELANIEVKQKLIGRLSAIAGLSGEPEPCRVIKKITKYSDGSVREVIEKIYEPAKWTEILLRNRFPEEFGNQTAAVSIYSDEEEQTEDNKQNLTVEFVYPDKQSSDQTAEEFLP